MNPPDSILIGATRWTVDHRDLNADNDDGYVYGRTKHAQAAIQLHNDQHPSCARDTLLHEILHAILGYSPLTLRHDEEEQIVRSIAPWLLTTLRDNPSLIEYLLADNE